MNTAITTDPSGNARLQKEFRHLLPVTLFGCLLVVGGGFGTGLISVLAMAYWTACCLIAAAPFSGRLGLGEMAVQLAQPIPREAIWREKLKVTIVAMLIISVIFLAVLGCLSLSNVVDQTWTPMALGSIVAAPLFTIPVGFGIMLQLEDERAAVLLNLLAAMALAALANAIALFFAQIFFFRDLPAFTGLVLVALSALMAPLVFRWARALLLKWEDHQPLRRAITMSLQTGTQRRTSRWANCLTLALKELHLQQTNCLFIAGMLLCGWAVRLEKEPDLAMVAMTALVTLFGPMMLGLGTVCEEHRLGVHAQQNTQPSGINRQWCVKFCVCFFCATALGWVLIVAARELMPETRGSAIRLMSLGTINEIAGYPFARGSLLRYAIASAYGVILGMVFGALFRSYLRSIVALLVFYLVAGWSIEAGAELITQVTWMHKGLYSHFVLFFTTCTLGIALYFLGKTHYAFSELTSRAMRRHAIIFSIVFLSSWPVGHAVYLRSWEHITLHRSEGPSLFHAEQIAGFLPKLMTGSAVDPEGRLWTTQFPWIDDERQDPLRFFLEDDRPIWKEVVGNREFIFALRTNGTLWVRSSARLEENRERWRKRGFGYPKYPHSLTQFGEDSDWATVAGRGLTLHALKQNGTLWSWGRVRTSPVNSTNHYEFWDKPRQIGNDDDWIQIALVSSRTERFALKKDGTLWHWGRWRNPHYGKGSPEFLGSLQPQLMNTELNGRITELRATPRELMAKLDNGTAVIFNQDHGGLPYNANTLEPLRARYAPLHERPAPTIPSDRHQSVPLEFHLCGVQSKFCPDL